MHIAREEPREDILSALEFRYRRVLTWASIVTLVCMLNVSWQWTRSGEKLFDLLIMLPLFLPYGFIPLRLHSRRLRSGLTLALAMGCALLIPGIYLLRFAFIWDKRWWILGNLTLGLLMQPVLIVIAAKTFFSMPPVPHGRVKMLGSLAYGSLLFGLFWSLYSPVPRYIRDNEHFAMSYLSDCVLSAFFDADEHGGLYPTDFANLASSSTPKCITTGPWVINPRNPTHGYFFEYSGSTSSSTLEGCTRFKSFTMTARPVVFGRTGIRSFFIDRLMDIHATSENRPAKAIDPIDSTLVFEHRPQ
jgi:hypothetical protein